MVTPGQVPADVEGLHGCPPQECDGPVVVPHGQAQVSVGGPVLGIGAVVPLAVQHILDVLYR